MTLPLEQLRVEIERERSAGVAFILETRQPEASAVRRVARDRLGAG